MVYITYVININKGAGALPTGSTIISYIMGIILDVKYNRSPVDVQNLIIINKGKGEYYIRLQIKNKPGVLGKITEVFANAGISMVFVVKKERSTDIVPLIFITYEIDKTILNKILDKTIELDGIYEIGCVLRIEKL